MYNKLCSVSILSPFCVSFSFLFSFSFLSSFSFSILFFDEVNIGSVIEPSDAVGTAFFDSM